MFSHLFRISSLVNANLFRHLDTVWLLHKSESVFCYSRLEGDEFALKEAICPGTKSLIMFLVSWAAGRGHGRKEKGRLKQDVRCDLVTCRGDTERTIQTFLMTLYCSLSFKK